MPPTTRRAATAASVVVALLLGACGGATSEDERRRLADDLRSEVGERLGRAEADCVAAGLQEEYGDDSFQQVLDAADARQDEGEDEDEDEDEDVGSVRSTVIDIFADCDALDAVATTDG